MRASVEEHGDLGFVQQVREHLLGRAVSVQGRTIVDEQGAMILAEGLSIESRDAQMRATELRAQWGWS
jgi:ribosomal protein S19E (S16A)